MLTSGYAVVPDETGRPAAVFQELEDAIDWGLRSVGADKFSIRWVDAVAIDPKKRLPAS